MKQTSQPVCRLLLLLQLLISVVQVRSFSVISTISPSNKSTTSSSTKISIQHVRHAHVTFPQNQYKERYQFRIAASSDSNNTRDADPNEGDIFQNENNNDITLKGKAEVLGYRFTLTSAAVAYSAEQLSKLLLGSGNGTGLSSEAIASFEYISHATMSWGILFAALLAPPYLGAITDKNEKNDVDNALFLLLNELLPTMASFAIVVEIINTIQTNLSQGTQNFLSASSNSLDNIGGFFICAICLREIGFFGASYKAEAVLAILLSVALGLNDIVGFSDVALTGGLALCLLVLSFGKLFEPLVDDMRPNGSAFFKDDRV